MAGKIVAGKVLLGTKAGSCRRQRFLYKRASRMKMKLRILKERKGRVCVPAVSIKELCGWKWKRWVGFEKMVILHLMSSLCFQGFKCQALFLRNRMRDFWQSNGNRGKNDTSKTFFKPFIIIQTTFFTQFLATSVNFEKIIKNVN